MYKNINFITDIESLGYTRSIDSKAQKRTLEISTQTKISTFRLKEVTWLVSRQYLCVNSTVEHIETYILATGCMVIENEGQVVVV